MNMIKLTRNEEKALYPLLANIKGAEVKTIYKRAKDEKLLKNAEEYSFVVLYKLYKKLYRKIGRKTP